jgi:hypothetical protein
MKHFTLCVCLFAVSSGIGLAQVPKPAENHVLKQQVTLQGGGVFTRKTTNADVTYEPTSSAGVLAAYRYNFTHWLGVEGDYEVFRDSQKLASPSAAFSLKENVQVATANAVISFSNPLTKKLESFITVGGGQLIFDPRDAPSASLLRKNVIAIGGGNDFILSRRLALRVQVESFTYKPPVFASSTLKTNKYVQTMTPTVGIVYKF